MLDVSQISYLEAILGNDNVDVEVVDGSVEIKVPSGCQPETVLRIRGKGAPQLNNASVSLAYLASSFTRKSFGSTVIVPEICAVSS